MRNWQLWGGGLLLLFFLCLAIFSSFLAPYPLGEKILAEQLASPSLSHWLGQNHHGEDLFTLVIYGSRVSLLVGGLTVLVSFLLGTTLGLISGYQGGKVDGFLARIMDMVLAFPGILLAIAITAVLPPSLFNVVLALAAGGWVSFARLVRAQTFSLKHRDFVIASRSLGARTPRILFRHILPNLSSSLVVQATFSMAGAILAESSLSFLGLGVAPGTPSWGRAVSDGTRYLLQAPHLALFPGLAIMLMVLALNLLGAGLRERYDL